VRAARLLLIAALLLVGALHARAELEHVELMTGGAAVTDPVPIVVAIHGLGDRPEAFQLLLDDLAAKARLIVPRAPTPYGTDGGGAWFEMHSGDEPMTAAVAKAAEEVAALISAVHAKYGGPPRAVVTGFSQGGIVTFALAAARPDLVAAAVPVAGFLPMPMWPAQRPKLRPLPRVLALHGEKDPVVPIQSAKWSIEALRSNGFDVQLRSYPDLGHTMAREVIADLHEAIVVAVTELTPKKEEAPAQASSPGVPQAAGADASDADAAPGSVDRAADGEVPAAPAPPTPAPTVRVPAPQAAEPAQASP